MTFVRLSIHKKGHYCEAKKCFNKVESRAEQYNAPCARGAWLHERCKECQNGLALLIKFGEVQWAGSKRSLGRVYYQWYGYSEKF